MTKHLLCAIAVIALLLTGCATGTAGGASDTAPTKTVRTEDVPVSFRSVDATADLDVSEKKVMGTAKRASTQTIPSLQEQAILNALRTAGGPNLTDMPDILVEPRFIFEHNKTGRVIGITVVGYPAKFRKARHQMTPRFYLAFPQQ